MKYILHFLGTELLFIVYSAIASAVCAGINLLFHPSQGYWRPFLYGGIGLFFIFNIIGVIHVIAQMIRFRKDPVYRSMFMNGGIDWKTYKKLRDKHNQ